LKQKAPASSALGRVGQINLNIRPCERAANGRAKAPDHPTEAPSPMSARDLNFSGKLDYAK